MIGYPFPSGKLQTHTPMAQLQELQTVFIICISSIIKDDEVMNLRGVRDMTEVGGRI